MSLNQFVICLCVATFLEIVLFVIICLAMNSSRISREEEEDDGQK